MHDLCAQLQQAGPLEVRTKGGANQYADPGEITLVQAAQWLTDGQVYGVQVRYGWQGQHWIDTLTRTPDGQVKVLRMAVSAPDHLAAGP